LSEFVSTALLLLPLVFIACIMLTRELQGHQKPMTETAASGLFWLLFLPLISAAEWATYAYFTSAAGTKRTKE
jgi:hypothetical protein